MVLVDVVVEFLFFFVTAMYNVQIFCHPFGKKKLSCLMSSKDEYKDKDLFLLSYISSLS